MELKIYLSMGVVAAVVVAFWLGYRSGYTRASGRAVIFASDATDGRPQGAAKEGYEPYFTKANPIPSETK